MSAKKEAKMRAFRLGKCKKGGFLQGGGATFWQAKNGGFWGPGSRARLVPRVAKTVRKPNATFLFHYKNIKSLVERKCKIFRQRCSSNASIATAMNIHRYRHSELAERTES